MVLNAQDEKEHSYVEDIMSTEDLLNLCATNR